MHETRACFFFLLITLKPRVEWYNNLWALHTSPHRNRPTFLLISCSQMTWIDRMGFSATMHETLCNSIWCKLVEQMDQPSIFHKYSPGHQASPSLLQGAAGQKWPRSTERGSPRRCTRRARAPGRQKSTPPQNRQLNISLSNSEQQVDDYVGQLIF